MTTDQAPEFIRPQRTGYGTLIGLAIASAGREMFANFLVPDGRILFFAVPDFELFSLLTKQLTLTARSRFVSAKNPAQLTIWKDDQGFWRIDDHQY